MSRCRWFETDEGWKTECGGWDFQSYGELESVAIDLNISYCPWCGERVWLKTLADQERDEREVCNVRLEME